jgi:predicted AlkP superfamily pyrophosphatase or phosphodiesterase
MAHPLTVFSNYYLYSMKKSLLISLLSLSAISLAAQTMPLNRPKLVIGLVFDQMRWDYLYRYYDRFGTGGFRRLMDDGFRCENTFINYLPAYTAPGHSCIYTGSIPAIHGIAANDWLDIPTNHYTYCTDDPTVKSIGGSTKAGMMSPRNLLASTITDELRLATNMRSRVYGIALKDRSCILPAGHLANGAYWFDDSTGNFISSTYYGEGLPQWVNTFNNRHVADSLIKLPWELSYPINTYTHSLPDDNAYEGPFPGEQTATFPHRMAKDAKAGYNILRYAPAGNTLTLMMAQACIEAESMGQRNTTDFLCLSFSSTDYAGHRFAPNSVEMEDMFIKMDKELAAFLTYLDKTVGKGSYTIFVTADHGGAHNNRYLQSMNAPAGSFDYDALYPQLNQYLKKKYSKDSLTRMMVNYQVYLNEKAIETAGLDHEAVSATATAWLQQQPGVAYAVDMNTIAETTLPEPIKTMCVNGYNHRRSGSIQIILDPAYYEGKHETGTTHGTWNPYDTHIPLLWYGHGIAKGHTYRTTHMTDISATLAALLHIQMPNGSVGSVIGEVVR